MKGTIKFIGFLLVLFVTYFAWHVHVNYRFGEVSKNKVYQSALIPPEKLESFLIGNRIKTVINLLDPKVQDALNPGKKKQIDAENRAIAIINKKYNLSIRHINIPSGQIPSKQSLTEFFKVLDHQASYPVLIHCYHGTGRAQMYSALYRIEYENWKNEDAREETRLIIEAEALGYKSSFANGTQKGDYLMNYKSRSHEKNNLLDGTGL